MMACICSAIAIVLTFVVTWIMGFSASRDGEAKELADTLIKPAIRPVIPLEIHTAAKGRFRGMVTP